uniref:Olfactory receptor n=1 Tax=Pelusios castaneus TaxID=367368 RepID=A0A8C8S0Z3_9SAUR
MQWKNQTSISKFLLLGFSNLSEVQILLFVLFLVIYIMTIAGNLLILVLVVVDHHLHTPMYFFLANLSFLEICYTTVIAPRLMLASLLTGDRTISFRGCITQFYVFGSMIATECLLLSVMSYDRYLAICKPLHYAVLMNGRFCIQLTVCSWVSGFLAPLTTMLLMLQLTFCGTNELDHFFCDLNPMLKLACTDTHSLDIAALILCSILTLPPFLLTLTSYVCIITSILRIPSSTGRQKAFSTCSSHLIVVTIFYGTLVIVYLLPNSDALRDLNKMFSIFYGVLTPLVNPLIYSLRNKEVKEALRKAGIRLFVFLLLSRL